jgi:hypothetical protein
MRFWRGTGHGEEVDADEGAGVVRKERPPGLGRGLAPVRHQPRHRALGNVDAEFEQLAMDAGRAPSKILGRHPVDQVAELLGRRGATWALLARLAAPEEAKAAAMPADHCVGTDDYKDVGPMRPNARKPRPEDPVCALEPEPFGPGTTENHELLAEGKVLQS